MEISPLATKSPDRAPHMQSQEMLMASLTQNHRIVAQIPSIFLPAALHKPVITFVCNWCKIWPYRAGSVITALYYA